MARDSELDVQAARDEKYCPDCGSSCPSCCLHEDCIAVGERDVALEALEEAQGRLRKANCDYGEGWINDDLECGIDVEPWCGKHAVLYYIKVNKEAQGKLDRIVAEACVCGGLPALCIVHDSHSVIAHILKEGNE